MKKGSLSIEYLAVIVLVLLALVVLLMFATNIGDRIVEGIRHFFQNMVGRG